VPLPDASVDLAILSQALHHARHPQVRGGGSVRILRPGGQVLVLDLNEHSFEKARELYADLWLGFKESALHGFLKKAGFAKVEVTGGRPGDSGAVLRDAAGERTQGAPLIGFPLPGGVPVRGTWLHPRGSVVAEPWPSSGGGGGTRAP
jgi:SAM-dependent methyltransferase